MVARARWLVPADARRRGLFWLCLFCCLSINTGQSANPADTPSDAPPPSSPDSPPPSSTASPPPSSPASPTPKLLPTCTAYRPFLCYAYEGLNQPYPEWLQQSDTKCSACTLDTPCDDKKKISGNLDDTRAIVSAKCRPQFCKSDDASSIETDCIQPVSINGEKVFFPFNVCTREMVAFGECDGKKLSTEIFNPITFTLTTDYLVQCDAGFTVPKLVVDARDADSSAEAQRQKLTCVPSLQQAAGFLKDDPSPLQNYPYDVPDLLDFTYCEKGGRPYDNSTCQPLPLCGKDNETPTPPFGPGTVQAAPDCDVPCHYEYGRMDYSDCVFLDIVDVGARRSFSAWRGMSGPWAEFMDEEQNVMFGVNTANAPPLKPLKPYGRWRRMTYRSLEQKLRNHVADPLVRKSREEQSQPKFLYPKCINAALLSAPDIERVEKDLLLNCKTNIFVQRLGEAGLVIEPPRCIDDQDSRICTNRTEAGARQYKNIVGFDASFVDGPIFVPIIGLVVLCVVVLAVVVFFGIRKRKYPAYPFPKGHRSVYIGLKEAKLVGNWAEAFLTKLSATPARPGAKKVFTFSPKEHVALQSQKPMTDALKPTINVSCNETKSKETTPDPDAQKTSATASKDPTSISKNILNRLSELGWLCEMTVKKVVDTAAPGDTNELPDPDATELVLPKPEFDQAEMLAMFKQAREIVSKQRGAVQLTGPVWIIGDLTGDFVATWRIFEAYSTMADPGTKMLFLGNVYDPTKPPSALLLVVAAQILSPENVFYLCGASEGDAIKASHGDEWQKAMAQYFDFLPVFATIDRQILALNGGPFPALSVHHLRNGFDVDSKAFRDFRATALKSRPNHNSKGYEERKGEAVGGFFFGRQAINSSRRKLGIDYIICANEVAKTGVRFFGEWLACVYSTPISGNDGLSGVMQYDGAGVIRMLHFICFGKFMTRKEFIKLFNGALHTDGTYAKNNMA